MIKLRSLRYLPWIALLPGLTGPVTAQNLLIENSSFEAGLHGFDPLPYVFVRNWETFRYPEITSETAAHGEKSLKLFNPSGMDMVRVIFPPIQFSERTRLVVSFYAKSSVAGTKLESTINCGWYRQGPGFSRQFRLSREWTRYSHEMEVMADPVVESSRAGRPGYYFLSLNCISPDNDFQEVWIDAVQIEKNELTPYAPARSVDLGVDLAQYPEKRHRIYLTGETEDALFHFFAAQPGTYSIRYTVTDVLDEKEVLSGQIPVRMETAGSRTLSIPLPPIGRTLYRIDAEISDGPVTHRASRLYGGIHDLSDVSKSSRYFGGSVETTELFRPPYLRPRDITYRLGTWRTDPGVIARLAKQIGWEWIHFYHQVSVGVFAPEPDVRTWEDADAITDIYRDAGLEIMALLTSHGNYHTPYFHPKWMLTGKPSEGGRAGGEGAALPSAEAYEKLAEEAARHFAGRINHWESWNEPGVKMRPHEYMPLHEAFYRGIKKGNPAAFVLGLCGTWDIGGDLYGWVRQCLNLGAADSMDAIAIHGYHARQRDYGAEVRRIAREMTGREIPVWDTESGKVNPLPYGHPNAWRDKDSEPATTADDLRFIGQWLVKHCANG
ncbi:MAG: hypothetical protein U1E27_04105, partial [Kiritimatiellia bacterium]|nr:hypothetical protein [Kiritimatiellia bacterium]